MSNGRHLTLLIRTINGVFNLEILKNRRTRLIKVIIEIYTQIRLFHAAKCAAYAGKGEYIRHRYTLI